MVLDPIVSLLCAHGFWWFLVMIRFPLAFGFVGFSETKVFFWRFVLLVPRKVMSNVFIFLCTPASTKSEIAAKARLGGALLSIFRPSSDFLHRVPHSHSSFLQTATYCLSVAFSFSFFSPQRFVRPVFGLFFLFLISWARHDTYVSYCFNWS
jgi:hypothetical protein